jgi:hypothetical protein
MGYSFFPLFHFAFCKKVERLKKEEEPYPFSLRKYLSAFWK